MIDDGSWRVLRPGEDITLWPYMKRARARNHVRELEAAFELHSASHKAGFEVVVSEDRRSARILARLETLPPVREWSLIAGDAIHNYRAALDALAWELVHLEGRKPDPKFEKSIYFPICESRTLWSKQVKGPLSTIPPEILDRLETLQPFHYEPAHDGIFVWLHRLDITDKHKASISAVARAVPRESFRAHLVLQDNRRAADVEWTMDWSSDGKPIYDGQELFHVKVGHPIEELTTDVPLPLAMEVEHGSNKSDIAQMFLTVEAQLHATFRTVLDGDFDPLEIGKDPASLRKSYRT